MTGPLQGRALAEMWFDLQTARAERDDYAEKLYGASRRAKEVFDQ